MKIELFFCFVIITKLCHKAKSGRIVINLILLIYNNIVSLTIDIIKMKTSEINLSNILLIS